MGTEEVLEGYRIPRFVGDRISPVGRRTMGFVVDEKKYVCECSNPIPALAV
jgi:hypothetical protein